MFADSGVKAADDESSKLSGEGHKKFEIDED
jgi:hypothetical protein